MTDNWDRVSTLFAAARTLPPPLLESFLALACEGDDNIRAQVQTLLDTDIHDDNFMLNLPWAHLVPQSHAPLATGQILKGRYRVDEVLAAGGQALVYRATDQLLTRSVVIKVMRAESRLNQSLKSRFEREMKALASIDHPGVVGIIDVGELEDASPFLVIQHIPGQSLQEVLASGPMKPVRVAEVVRQMASALHAAHVTGVAHRDLKPGNVMLQTREGGAETVKLIDFGIAKIDTDDLESNTTSVLVAGTVRYMAPEQFEGKHSTASDIYSMALIVCEMLCGVPDVRTLPRSTPAKARALLESALAYRAVDRPADVQRWSSSLAQSLSTKPRRRITVAAIAAVILIATAGPVLARRWASALEEPVRVVEKIGAFDPITEGFKIKHDVTARIVENEARTGYDAWRIITHRQGYYFRPFTAAQRRVALENGWKVTAVMKAESGIASVVADFASIGRRFDIQVVRFDDSEIVRLTRQLVPDVRGLEFVQSPAGQFHEYELIYDPEQKSAQLWVDKKLRLTGYAGHNQFQEEGGLIFASSVFKHDSASAVFKSVRFEINP